MTNIQKGHQGQPLVSIIVITYNSAEYVLETLESVREQTYMNLELIISDDASTDITIDICKNWLAENKDRFVNAEMITVVKNTGVPANCNRGLKFAHGEWIKIIAADDALYHDAIENIITFVGTNRNVEVLMTQIEIFNETFNPENSKGLRPSYKDNLDVYSEKATSSGQLEYLLNGGFHYTAGLFVKNIYDEIGMYDERYNLIEDTPFYLNLGMKGKAIRFAPILTLKYRKHKNNLTNAKRKLLPSYYYQTYTAVSRTSWKYGKLKYILNNYWHRTFIFLIFKAGNHGFIANVLNKIRMIFQPVRFYNLIAKLF